MSKIIFFCHAERSTLDSFEYYKQDIDALKALNHQVIICTKFREIPLNYDVMFIWWWTYALYPVLLSRLLRKPCIITGTFNFRYPKDFNGRDYFNRPFWQKLLIKMATELSTLNLFVSQLELLNCSEYFKLKNARYYPHIIHDDYLQGPIKQREKALFNISWSGKENLKRKGIPELLIAIQLLKDEGILVKLYLGGMYGDGVDYLLTMIKDLKISDEVKYLGMLSREDKIKMLRTSEIYVQPSHYEGFGLATAEAMGCGACVIVCDTGAVKEVVGDFGYYVSPGSSIDLAYAIKHVLFDDNLRHKLQESACQRIYSNFTFDKKLERLKKYLSEIGIL
ncbi:MAG: glycosyltransferase [Prolixibacteraceae bacterium]